MNFGLSRNHTLATATAHGLLYTCKSLFFNVFFSITFLFADSTKQPLASIFKHCLKRTSCLSNGPLNVKLKPCSSVFHQPFLSAHTRQHRVQLSGDQRVRDHQEETQVVPGLPLHEVSQSRHAERRFGPLLMIFFLYIYIYIHTHYN